jgi:N-acetylglucosaminyl-diphospho-decaprenol L-rhamnosyltransferase
VALVDVVVVSYNSARTLRGCVAPLADDDKFNVIVVDNASSDRSLESIADLSIAVLPLERNAGFAYGCNRGWQAGSAPFVLFLNPDARIEPDSLVRLASALQQDESIGLVAPRLLDEDGSLECSQRRFPRLRSTYARALFLHRVFSRAAWTDEVVRDRTAYERAGNVEWVSGACALLRRSALERLGGWNEGFFMYAEDVDLCRRLWSARYAVRYEPAAHAVHEGGVSAPRAHLLPTLAASRIRYAQLHRTRGAAMLERIGIALEGLTHAVLTTKGRAARAGHRRALRVACSLDSDAASRSARTESVRTTVEIHDASN